MSRVAFRTIAVSVVLVLVGLSIAHLPAQSPRPSDVLYGAIRANDLAQLGTLVKSPADANTKDDHGVTPLMHAAAVGSADAMQRLLDAGADPNIQNEYGSTALMWAVNDVRKVRLLLAKKADVNLVSKGGRTALLIAALSDGSAAVVRALLDAGADAHVVDSVKTTALLAAAQGNDTETLRLLAGRGLDVNAADFTGLTPLMYAAAFNNAGAVKFLIAKGANVNAVSGDGSYQKVKAGTIALGNFTALLLAAPFGPGDAVTALLDAGARPNVQDVRGMTPLMLAVATDRQDPQSIRALLAKSADVNVKSTAGETALDWARKIGRRSTIDLLGRAGAMPGDAKPVDPPSASPADLPTALQRSVGLLEKTSAQFARNGGCASCHAQNITDIAVALARQKGVRVDEAAAADRRNLTRLPIAAPPAQAALLERRDLPAIDVGLYALAAMATNKVAPDRATDILVANIVANQLADGRWHLGFAARPPIEDGDIFRTALGIRALKTYGPPGLSADLNERLSRATRWLLNAKPTTTEDRSMQLLGARWADVDLVARRKLARAIVDLQRPDGGWSQTPDLRTDAYATGQALVALVEGAGTTPTDPAYERGVKYLLSTQRGDGSWFVRSRAPKFQPYFESGFPYGHDQWISSMATGWAASALALTAESGTRRQTD